MNCLVCKKEIKPDHERIVTKNGDICMGCEGAEITVYHIRLPGESSGYYELEISHIIDMMKECEHGEGYTITKESILAGVYYNLPEFEGF